MRVLFYWAVVLVACRGSTVDEGRSLAVFPDLFAKGSDQIDANCTISKFPDAYVKRVYFFSFIASDLYHMLAHALRHYKHLGIDFRSRALFVVHNASGVVPLEKTTAYLERYGAQYNVSNTWSSATKREAVNAYMRSLPSDAWLVGCGAVQRAPPFAANGSRSTMSKAGTERSSNEREARTSCRLT